MVVLIAQSVLDKLPGDHSLYYQLCRCRRILSVVGAGISTAAGVPDFRSKGGLYDSAASMGGAGATSGLIGKELFDANLFRDEAAMAVFLKFINNFNDRVKNAKSTCAHLFLKHLQDNERLVRVYSQNIDMLVRILVELCFACLRLLGIASWSRQ